MPESATSRNIGPFMVASSKEGTPESTPVGVDFASVPTQLMRQGNFSELLSPASSGLSQSYVIKDISTGNPFAGNIIPKSRISAVSQNLAKIMQAHYLPQVKGPDGQYALINNAFFPIANQAGFEQTQFSTKSDYIIASKHRLSGSFVFVAVG